MNWIKKYWRATIFTIAIVACAFFAVMGWHYTDEANTPFWWNAWIVIALVALVSFVLLIVWFSRSKNKW